MTALALALLVATAPASWAAFTEPARGGTVDVSAALGGELDAFAGSGAFAPSTSLAPAGFLSARWGLTDNVQLALPLLLTGSFSLDDGVVGADTAALPAALRPRFALTTGLLGVGYSSSEGVILVPEIVGSVSLVGKRRALFANAFGTASTVDGLTIAATTVGASAGMAFLLDDRLSLGFSAGVASTHIDVGTFKRDGAVVRLGSRGANIPADVPTVRYVIGDELSFELWTFVDVAVGGDFAGSSSVGAVAGATYHLGY